MVNCRGIRNFADMKKTLGLAGCMLCWLSAFGWGQKGHDVTASIAQNHLTPAAASAVDSLLQGQSMVYWANWLDGASHTPKYDYSKTWHYKNIDPEYTYESMPPAPGGDIVSALKEQTKFLSSGAGTRAENALALKMIIHLMGDLHQPLHMGWKKDRGGNGRSLYFFERATNLHSLWDSSLPEGAHKWSYTEWTDQIDRANPGTIEIITSGSFDDWGRETASIAADVYAATPEESKISYDYIQAWTPVVEQQLLKAGLRLAQVLNGIFDSRP